MTKLFLNTTLSLLLAFIFHETGQGQVLGTAIESWDFSNGLPSNWSSGSSSGIAHWEYRGPSTNPNINICSRGSCGAGTVPIQSLTQSNGFMIFDSNFWDDPGTACGGNIGGGSDPGPHTAWLITNSIDLSAHPEVYITFQQQLRSYSATSSVQYSINNGATWQNIPSLDQTGVITSPSVQWKSASIGSLVGGQANVKFKFLFDGFYYHWCIDDITVYTPAFNNLQVSNTQFTNYNELVNPLVNMMYDQFPAFMPPTVLPNCSINNIGTNSQNNIIVQNKIIKLTTSTTIYDQSTAPVDIAAGANATASNPSQIITNGVGDYIVTFDVTQNQTDEDYSNNKDTLDFEIHPFTIARDEGPADNIYNNNNIYPNTTTTEVGAIFKFPFNNLRKIYSMQVGIGEGTLPGTIIQGYIYIPSMDSILATTQPYTINLADINGIGEEKMITLPLITPLPINSATLDYPEIVLDTITNETMPNPYVGSIAAMVRNMSPGQPFYIARSGEAPANTTYLHYPDEQDLYYLLKIPQVRLNLFTNTQVPGCMVDSAMNYNPLATVDDGSCDYPGCTQEQYDNYSPVWNWDDGSCIYIGCLDPAADNYNPLATQIVNCIYSGCMDPLASNFDPIANVSDSSCIYPGCMDPLADNFNPTANFDDGSCYYLGCTNTLATNYDSTATVDDGSCLFAGCTDPLAGNYNPSANVDDGSCFYLGCMDINADNYDSTATVDDGSCFYLGCTDALANNYDPTATVNDGSCLYYGCTDNTAINFEATANFNDGSCMYLIASLFSDITSGCNPLTITVINQTISYPQSTCEFIFSNGDTIYNCSPSFNYTFDTPGDYSITYNYYYDGFPSTAQLNNIVVHPIPNTPIISDNNGILTCGNITPGLNYQWQLNGINIFNATNSTFNNTTITNYLSGDFQLIATNAFGCADTSLNLHVLQPRFTLTDNTICQNETAQISVANLNVPNTNCMVNWGDGLSEIIIAPILLEHNYTNAGNYTIDLTCMDLLDTGYYSDNLTVDSIPIIPLLNYNFGNLSIINPESGINYQWENNQMIWPGASSTNLNLFNNGIYQNGWYNANAVNSWGCVSSSDSIFIAQPYFTNPQDSICPNISLLLNNTTEIISPMVCSTNWGDGTLNTNDAHSYTQSGFYSIEMTCSAFGQSYTYLDSIFIFTQPNQPQIQYNYPNVLINNFETGVSYQWYLNQALVSGATSSTLNIFNVNTFNNGWYEVTSTNNLGCAVYSDSLAVLQPYFNISDPSVCPGEATVLNQLTQAWDETCNVNWGDGYIDALTNSTISHIYNDTASYMITMNCINPFTNGYYTTSITMNPIPDSPLLTYTIGTVQCTNFDMSLNYQWYYNQNPVSGSVQSAINVFNGNNFNNGWYEMAATNNFNCTTYSDSLYVLQPFFFADINLACANDSISINNQTQSNSAFNCTIQWGDGSTTLSNDPVESHLYNQGSEYLISMVCSDNFGSGYYTDTVTILSAPLIPSLQYNQPNVWCTNCSAGLSYDWSVWNNDIANATNYNWNIWNGANYTNGPYQLNVIGINGCTSSSDTLWIVQPYFEIAIDSICQFDSTAINNLTDGLSWLTCTIHWGDGTTAPWSMNPAYHNYSGYGPENITLECQSNTNSTIGTMQQSLMVMPTPQPLLLDANGSITCSNGSSQWITSWVIDNQVQSPFANTLSISNELGMNYLFTATTDFGCQGSSSITTNFVPPLVQEQVAIFSVYPNPTHDFINVPEAENGDRIQIMNSEGKIVFISQIQSASSRIDISSLAQGMYTISIIHRDQLKTAQFLISR